MNTLSPEEIRRILDVTDQLGLHREAVAIHLQCVPGGKVALFAQKKVMLNAPADIPLDEWLKALPSAIRSLDLSAVRRA